MQIKPPTFSTSDIFKVITFKHSICLLIVLFHFSIIKGQSNYCGVTSLSVTASSCTTESGSTAGLTNDTEFESSCFGNEDDEGWYWLTGGTNGTDYTVEVTSTGGSDMVVSIVGMDDASCSNATEIDCVDDVINGTESITFTWTATYAYYYVQIYDYGTGAATFDICAYDSGGGGGSGPANDECSGAILLTQNTACTYTSGTIEDATDSGISTSCGTANDDVWFSFVATSSNPIIELDANFNGVVEVFSGSCGSLTSIECADDWSFIEEEIFTSGLSVGSTYYIRVHSSSSSTESVFTFDLCVYGPPDGTGSEESDCSGASVLCDSGTVNYNPTGAGIDDFAGGTNDGCLSTEHLSAWYYIEINDSAPAGGSDLTFVLTPDGGDTEDYDFAIYEAGDCDNLGDPIRCSFAATGDVGGTTGLQVGAGDDSEDAFGDSWVNPITVYPGDGFYILIDNYDLSFQGFSIDWGGEAADYLDCNADPNCSADAGTFNVAIDGIDQGSSCGTFDLDSQSEIVWTSNGDQNTGGGALSGIVYLIYDADPSGFDFDDIATLTTHPNLLGGDPDNTAPYTTSETNCAGVSGTNNAWPSTVWVVPVTADFASVPYNIDTDFDDCWDVGCTTTINYTYTLPTYTCGDVFVDNGGDPGDYCPNSDPSTTNWLICPSDPTDDVTLEFTSWDVESFGTFGGDQMMIYNGDDDTAPLIGAYSGTNDPGTVTSTAASGCLYITFESDGTVEFEGWIANVVCGTPPPPPCDCTDPVCGGMHWDCSTAAEDDYNDFSSFAAGYDIDPDYVVTNGETYELCWDYTTGANETTVGFVHALGYEFSGGTDECDFDRVYHVYEAGCGTEISSTGPADFSSHGLEYVLSPNTTYSFCADITITTGDCISLADNFVYLYNADGGGGCGTCAVPCTDDGMGSVTTYDDRTYLSCWTPDCDIYGPGDFTNCFEATADATGFLGFANQIQNSISGCIDISWELTASGECSTVITPDSDNANGVSSGFNPEYSGLTSGGTYVLCVTYSLPDFLCGLDGADAFDPDFICIDSYGTDCTAVLEGTSEDGIACKDDGIPLSTTVSWNQTAFDAGPDADGTETTGFLVFCSSPTLPLTEAYYNANAFDAILETFDEIGIEINTNGEYVDPFNSSQICAGPIYLVPITISQTSVTGFVFDWSCFDIDEVIEVELGVPPTVTATADPTEICAGESSELTATGGGTYLWSDGLGTNPVVTVTPTTTTTYMVTVTDDSGNCTSTADVTVTVTDPGTEPTTECWETATLNTTTCMWDITGTQPTEPTVECYETATFNDVTCIWDVSGTQPTEPTVECYETATFNDVTCIWDVSGTQPTEPTVECYETATFNDVTCIWDVSGTQPTEPTVECYETAMFNDVTCIWDVSGTQPTEPTVECYETATFNDVTCIWDVSGTQPTEPTVECYETATFNDVTCIWDVSGTQPTEPTVECYETATFNDVTCIWDVSGTQPTEPTVECYESTTFNNTTCMWEVSGTQPTEPTVECYETATFNDVTCMWDVTGTQPTEPTVECYETATFNDVTCMWDVSGTQPTEPTTECWETATFNNTSCIWVVTGTQPTEPTVECYETATFNDVTCMWDVTGTQPTEPTAECYESTSFNNTTCMWEVTGTQPTEPTVECYETSTFNDVTCMWDVTGTQPTEPTIECYETATFNDVTCMWEVSGTQPTEPTTECWETATFNNTSCMWVVTGTQPTEPTVECYETATFNDVTCMWDVSGAQPTEPTVECYESTSFNNTSCMWEVSGTQPTEPTVECYETATFNDVTCMWDVTGTQPTEPTVECYETTTFNDVTCMWDVSGTQPTEPTTECWETATFNNTSCMWVVTGTQPTEPTVECYETATFNDVTCMWDVTGTQPTEPTVECYESTTFNNTSCMWEVTGTQPTEPTVECYETATFNDVTCMWDVTGTQPTEPTVECYETATFNDVTCMWDVAGTQPTEPTTECWETATFNNTSCIWVVTGTQPTEPTVECYETATFNDVTCMWDVNGTQPTEPTVECYESTTFNNTTCMWEVTGTQPTEPTVECYETATFNDVTCMWDVTGTQPTEPTVECYETATFNDVTCMWDVSGTQPTEPTTECWETATFNNTSCIWVVTGSQPTEPTVECYETATFNDVTCMWDVTGTQPTEPTVECYESTTFNNTTCMWEVSGTQPTEPTVECYETATFNDVTCMWDVTGTQPTEPTVECYETATFNDVTCMWDVSGTQPTEPTTECWETATFNNTSCIWVVTGTQPTEPTVECYETATFNDVTCMWDVTGTQPTEPTVECYESTTFNNTTCMWEVSGTQPTEPTVECWETTTFNNTSCMWEVSGTQPVEPMVECYETATFNTTTCMWDVTGTQPDPPTFILTNTYCVGDTPEILPVSSDNGVSGSWNPNTINTANSGTVNYIFTPSDGCTSTFEIMITINDCGCTDPAFVTIDPINEICEDETIDLNAILSGSATSLTWTTSGNGTFDNTTSTDPTYTPGSNDIANGSVTVSVLTDDPDGSGPCTAASASTILTINMIEDPIFSLVADYCAGDVVDVLPTSSNNSITGAWTPSVIDDMTSGAYLFTPDLGQCANDFTLNVVITPSNTPTFTINDTYCVDDAADPLATTSDNGVIGTWNPVSINTASSGTTNYFFTPTNSCDEAFSISVTVTDCGCVDPAFVSIDPINTICENETLELNAVLSGSSSTVTWTSTGDGTFDDNTSSTPTYSPGSNDIIDGVVTLSVMTDDPDGTGPCSAASTSVLLVINTLTDPIFSLVADYCAGDVVDVLPTASNNSITGTWTPAMIDDMISGAYLFTPDLGQCANDFTLNVVITPSNTPIFTIGDTYCVDDAADPLSTTSDNGVTGTWNPVSINTTSSGTTNYFFTPIMSCDEAFSISVTVTDCGCVDPAFVSIDPINAICENETLELNAVLSGSSSTVTWTSTGDGTFDDNTSTTPTYTPGSNDAIDGVVTLSVMTDDPDGTGPCSAAGTSVLLVINTLTDPIFNLVADYCAGDMVDVLPTSSNNSITGAWTPSVIDDMTSGAYVFTADAGQCTNDFTLNVIITPSNTPIFTINDTYCVDDAADPLSTTSDNGVTGTWSPVSINTASSGTTNSFFTPTNSCDEAFSISVTVTDCGCMDPAFVSIDPINAICENETLELNAVLSGSATTVTWTSTGDGTFDDNTSTTPTYTPGSNDSTDGVVTLSVMTDDPDGTGPCSAAGTSVLLVINALTDPIFSLVTDYCAGDVVDVLPTSSNNSITGVWTPSVIDDMTSGAYLFTANAGQCANDFTLSVVITPSNTPIFTINDTYCVDDAADPLLTTSDNGVDGSWSPVSINAASSGTTNYFFTPTNSCDEAFSISITVTDCGCMDPAFVSIDPINAICENETLELNAELSGSASTVTWTSTGDGTFDDNTSTTPTYTPGSNDATDGVVTLSVMTDDPDGLGPCSAASTSVLLVINALNDPTFNLVTDYCAGDVVEGLPVASNNSITGSWTPSVIDDMTSGAYFFTPDVGQCANDFTLNVAIAPSNTPTFNISNTYCVNDAADLLSTTSDNGVDGAWNPVSINTASSGTTNYFFTPTNSCDEAFSISVTVTDCGCADPAFVSIDPINAICENETLELNAVLSGSATTVTWGSTGDGTFDNNTSTTPTYTPGSTDIIDGVVTLTVLTDDPDGTGPCSAANTSVLLVINALNEPTFNLIADYCVGDVVDVLPTSSNNNISGTWTPSVIDDMTSGAYLFTPDVGQCASAFTLNVVVTSSNTPAFSISNTYCVNDAPDLLTTTSDNGVDGTWSPVSINTASSGTTNYFFTPTNSCDEAFSISVTVTDCGCADPAFVSIDPINAICANETIILNAAISGSATSVTWTSTGDGIFEDNTSAVPMYTPGATDVADGVVTLSVMTDDPDGTGPCSAASTSIILMINNLTDASFNLESDYCAGDVVDALPTVSDNGVMGSWIPPVIDNMTSGSYLFIADAGQCVNDFTLNVIIAPTNIPTFSINDTYCVDDPADLLATTSDNGLDGSWMPAMINTVSAGVTDYLFTPTNMCDEAFSISVTVTDCDCMDPAFVSIDPINTICENQSIVLNAVISGSATSVTWTTSGDGTFDDNTSTAPTYSPGTTDIVDGVVTLTAMTDDPDGSESCLAAVSNVLLNITNVVDPIFAITETYCAGDDVNILNIISDNGVMGSWSPSSIDNMNSDIYTFTPAMSECANSYSLPITIDPCNGPECNLIVTSVIEDESCFGLDDGSVEIIIENAALPIIYTWDDTNLQGSILDGLRPGTYTVNYIDAMGCEGNYSFDIVAAPALTLEVTVDEILVPLNSDVNLMGTTNISDAEISDIMWNISEGIDCEDCLETIAQVSSPTNYILTIIDNNGCMIQDAVFVDIVKLDAEIYFPNIFSPNGDSDNQYFYPKGKNMEIINSLRVYDRWGNLVFENENFVINDSSQGWDGNYKGKPLNPGVFIYIASYTSVDGFEETVSGDITIVR